MYSVIMCITCNYDYEQFLGPTPFHGKVLLTEAFTGPGAKSPAGCLVVSAREAQVRHRWC